LGSGDIWFRFSCLELKINKEAFFRCVIRVCKNTFVSFGVNFGCSTFTGAFIAKLFQHKMLVEMQGIFFFSGPFLLPFVIGWGNVVGILRCS
jgi:hypothetical protein